MSLSAFDTRSYTRNARMIFADDCQTHSHFKLARRRMVSMRTCASPYLGSKLILHPETY